MKMKLYALTLILVSVLVLGLGSCATTCPMNEGQFAINETKDSKSVDKKLAGYEKVVVLGFNSTMGLRTKTMDDFVGDKKMNFADTANLMRTADIKIDFSAPEIEFPIGKQIDTHEQHLLKELQGGKFTLVSKNTLLKTAAYQKVSKPNRDPKFASLATTNVAEGYHDTYQFKSLTNDTESVINLFKKSLEESGADFGVIVVERPFVGIHKHSLFQQFLNKCAPYYTVATNNTYYIIQPATFNQVVVEVKIQGESGNRHLLKNPEDNIFLAKDIYTADMVEADKPTWLKEVDSASINANKLFVEWLNSKKDVAE